MGAPWLVLSWLAVLLPPNRRVAASWSMSFFAGFTAFTLMTMVATLLFAVIYAPRRQVIRDLGIAAMLFLGMVLIQLGPSLEMLSQSIAKYRTDWLQSGGGLPPKALASLLIPDYFHVFSAVSFHDTYDPMHLYEYSGIATFVLAMLAVWHRSFRMFGLLLTCLILMLGEHTERPISIVHSAFRSLPLPSGKHHVSFQYSTSLIVKCMIISIICWSLCVRLLLLRD